jgi:hypothetical protein
LYNNSSPINTEIKYFECDKTSVPGEIQYWIKPVIMYRWKITRQVLIHGKKWNQLWIQKTDTLVVLAVGRLKKTRTSNDSNFREHMQIENFIKIGIL